MYKKNSGITLVALAVTVTVIIILASISFVEGRKLLKTSKLQTIETNMLTVQAKVKAYSEEIEAKIWTESDKDKARNKEFSNKKFSITQVSDDALAQVSTDLRKNYVAYTITGDALKEMGLNELRNEKYIAIISKDNYKLMDMIWPDGIKYKDNMYYSLSSIQEILENE